VVDFLRVWLCRSIYSGLGVSGLAGKTGVWGEKGCSFNVLEDFLPSWARRSMGSGRGVIGLFGNTGDSGEKGCSSKSFEELFRECVYGTWSLGTGGGGGGE
jgi:hypothetical protein